MRRREFISFLSGAAKELRLEIPPKVLSLASEVIE